MRHVTDARNGGKRAALRLFLVRHGLRARHRRRVQHLVRHLPHPRHRRGQPDPREHIHVVALRRHQHLPPHRYGRKRRARGDDCPALRPGVGLLGGALVLVGRVRHGHHHWPLAVGQHRRHHLLREQPPVLRRQPQQAHWLELLHDVDHGRAVGHGGVDPLQALLVDAALGVGVAVAAVGAAQRPDRGAHHKSRHRLLPRQPRLHHPVHNLLAHAEPRRARARAHEGHVGERHPRLLRRRDDTGQGHTARALDVVVEAAVAVAVLGQQRDGLGGLEVLELNHAARPPVEHRLHELVDHVVVVGALQPGLADADVVRVLQQLLVVGPHVQHHR
mmetsp:Transcript_148/g.380  ORF Transcript_148/g.380 Transcript_148/m.380 type:complete len:332 (-) Transcript_148:754-1749(-)